VKEERAESWVEILSGAVSTLRSNDKLMDMLTQARHALAELRAQRGTDEADEASWEGGEAASAATGAEETVSEQEHFEQQRDALTSRLDALSASIGELTDLLDGGLERLETVEIQLGDPDESIDAQLAAGVERCQSRLAAVEHRLGAVASMLHEEAAKGAPAAAGAKRRDDSLRVQVVDGCSRRRCDLCVELEHQGLMSFAVADVAGAAARLALIQPHAILVPADTDPDEIAALAELLEAFGSTAMPAAATLVLTPQPLGPAALSAAAEVFGAWPIFCASEGAAALAAAVVAAARPQVVPETVGPPEARVEARVEVREAGTSETAAAEMPAADEAKPQEEVQTDVSDAEPEVACQSAHDTPCEGPCGEPSRSE